MAEVSLICFERNEGALRLYPHDFGAGASTFHYLRAFDIDFVKIDGSLIGSTSQRDKAIIKSVVKLCRELDIRTIAEMVETRGQAGWLERLKVDFGQGFLFGRPGRRIGPGTRRTARLPTYEHD